MENRSHNILDISEGIGSLRSSVSTVQREFKAQSLMKIKSDQGLDWGLGLSQPTLKDRNQVYDNILISCRA